MNTEDGKPTIANILMTELDVINQGLTDIFAIANTVVAELNALAEHHGVARTTEETISEVVTHIQKTSSVYAKKSEEEIRKEFGL